MRPWRLLGSFLATSLASSATTEPSKPIERPNLLFLIADQLRFDTLGYLQAIRSDYRGQLHVHTPNMDRLATQSIDFRTTYASSPVCLPSRATLRTGTVVARHGLGSNKLLQPSVYEQQERFQHRIESLVSLDQILAQHGYISEYYGKWHLPERLYYNSGMQPVVAANRYNFATHQPEFSPDVLNLHQPYRRALQQLLHNDDEADSFYPPGWQRNPLSGYPYQPFDMDVRFQASTNSPLPFSAGESDTVGRDSLDVLYTTSAVVGLEGLAALQRLTVATQPFSLTISFNSPHPPSVATSAYLDRYYAQRDQLYVMPSIHDLLEHSAYSHSDRYTNVTQLAELTAIYYALVEEVDHWVGELLAVLDASPAASSTIVVFTADHGEKLGAHGAIGKGWLLEDDARVPLLLRLPGHAPAIVDQPVSHLDVHATLLDAMGLTDHDVSDGTSLLGYLEPATRHREPVVVEYNNRIPMNANTLSSSLGAAPAFMIRYGAYKLILPRQATSRCTDMLYHLDSDPYEMDNLLAAEPLSSAIIGTAEHLRVLLLEWMERHDGDEHYYSDPYWHNGEGRGDVAEIAMRQTWPRLDYWQSTTQLVFDRLVPMNDGWMQHESIYIGRRSAGTLSIDEISLSDDVYFNVTGPLPGEMDSGEYARIDLTFWSLHEEMVQDLEAILTIAYGGGNMSTISLIVPHSVEVETSQERPVEENPAAAAAVAAAPTSGSIMASPLGVLASSLCLLLSAQQRSL